MLWGVVVSYKKTLIFVDIKRSKVQEWCIENEFELVELSPLHQDSEEGNFLGW